MVLEKYATLCDFSRFFLLPPILVKKLSKGRAQFFEPVLRSFFSSYEPQTFLFVLNIPTSRIFFYFFKKAFQIAIFRRFFAQNLDFLNFTHFIDFFEVFRCFYVPVLPCFGLDALGSLSGSLWLACSIFAIKSITSCNVIGFSLVGVMMIFTFTPVFSFDAFIFEYFV